MKNPIGTTSIYNENGDIVAGSRNPLVTAASGPGEDNGRTGSSNLIRTNILRMETDNIADGTAPEDDGTGNIGSASGRINIDIVDADDLPRSTTFESRSVFLADDSVTLSFQNTFFTGQQVTYQAATTALGGLTSGQNYYVILSQDGVSVQLAATKQDALDGVAIDLTSAGADTNEHTLTPITRFNVDSADNIFLDTLGRHRSGNAMDNNGVLAGDDPNYMITIDQVIAASDIDIILQTSVRETQVGDRGGVQVKHPADPGGIDAGVNGSGNPYVVFFLPDQTPTPSQYIGAYATDPSEIDSVYSFRDLDPVSGEPTEAGLTAGGNIIVKAADAQDGAAPFTNVLGITEIVNTGDLDFWTNGYITLTEKTGDMQVERIRSEFDDVLLYSPQAIVDNRNFTEEAGSLNADADVSGTNITMVAGADLVVGTGDFFLLPDAEDVIAGTTVEQALGGVGKRDAWLEINVDRQNTDGVLRVFDTTSTNSGGVWLDETSGDMRIHTIDMMDANTSDGANILVNGLLQPAADSDDVGLRTQSGSIIDARNDQVWNVRAQSIFIDANGGSIGTSGNDLDIDSRYNIEAGAIDYVGLEASTSIYLTETNDELYLVYAHTYTGDIRLTVREDGAPGGTDEGTADFILIEEGVTYFAQDSSTQPNEQTDNPRLILNGTLFAERGEIEVRAGDDITLSENSRSWAEEGIRFYGDARVVNDGPFLSDTDEGFGADIVIRGELIANAVVTYGMDAKDGAEEGSAVRETGTPLHLLEIFGNTDEDNIQFGDIGGLLGSTMIGTAGYVLLGSKTRAYGGQTRTEVFYDGAATFATSGANLSLTATGIGSDIAAGQLIHIDVPTGSQFDNNTGTFEVLSVSANEVVLTATGTWDTAGSAADGVALKSAFDDDGEDTFTVYALQSTLTRTSPKTADVVAEHTLTLDGQADTDFYEVHTLGSNGPDVRNYAINVLDSGDETDGVDEMTIFGNDDQGANDGSIDDIFLMRAAAFLPSDQQGGTQVEDLADRPGYVAILHGTLEPYEDIIPDNEDFDEVQRINYDTALNGRLTIEGRGGDDAFYSDDVTVIATYDGGRGDDTFQIGQIFGANRNIADGNLLAQDEFPELVATTRGWLSRGSSAPVLAQGGTGNDTFRVYSNQSELRLEGDDDNDLFIVRAFAIAATTDYDWNADGEINEADLDVGRAVLTHLYDHVEGPDFVLGTPDDSDATSALATLDAAKLFELGVDLAATDEAAATAYRTALDGVLPTGTGGERFDTNGDGGINFLDLFITQGDSTDDVIVLDEDGVASPQIGLGFSVAQAPDIRAGGGQDEVRYNINAPVSVEGGTGFDKLVILGTEFADDIAITDKGIFGAGLNVRYSTVEVVEVDGLEGDDKFYVRSTAFGVAYRVIGGLGSDIINVAGDVQEDIITRELEGVSGAADHLVQSDDIFYDGLVVDGLDYNVARNGEGLVVIDEGADGFTAVREGDTGGLSVDSYTVRLARQLTGDEVVYVTVSAARSPEDERGDNPEPNPAGLPGGEGDTMWISTTYPDGNPQGNSSIFGVDYLEAGTQADSAFLREVTYEGVDGYVANRAVTLRFDASNWDTAQDVFLWAVDDARAEGDKVVVVQHSVISQTSEDYDAVDVRNVEVELRDNDTPGVLVTEIDPESLTTDLVTGAVTGFVEDGRSLIVEGDTPTGYSDIILVELAREVAVGETVVVKLNLGDLTGNEELKNLTDQAFTLVEASGTDRFDADSNTITFDSTNWDAPVAIEIVPVEDGVREDPQTAVLSFGQNLETFGQNPLYGDTGLTVGLGDADSDMPDNLRLTLSGGGWVAGGVEAGETLTITGIGGLTSATVIGFEDAGLTAVLDVEDAAFAVGEYALGEATRDVVSGMLSTDATFVFPNLRSGTGLLDVEVIDDDTPGSVVLESGRDTVLIPATATAGIFDTAGSTITALEENFDWRAEGFDVGHVLEIEGGSTFDGMLTITAISGDTITVNAVIGTTSKQYARIVSQSGAPQTDTYQLRLTQEPTADVTVSILTDGLADVSSINGVPVVDADYTTIGDLRAVQKFVGTLDIDSTGASTTLTRTGASNLGNFLSDGWKVGDLLRVTNADAGIDGSTLEIAEISTDGKTITLLSNEGVNLSAGEDVILSLMIERDIWSGGVSFQAAEDGSIQMVRNEAFVTFDPEIIDVNDPDSLAQLEDFENYDVQGFLKEGFLEGQRVRITNLANTAEYVDAKIAVIRGFNDTKDHTIQFTFENNEDFDATWLDLAGGSEVQVEVNRLAVQATFTSNGNGDPTDDNYWQFQTIELTADPFYDVPTTREGVKIFPVKAHRLSDIRGPLAVEGGPSGADRSLTNGVKLPGETDEFLIAIGTQAPESQQIDILNIFNDGSWADTTGVLTETTLSGFGMGPDLVFPFVNGPLFGEGAENAGPVTLTYAGGISFGKVNFGSSGVTNNSEVSTIEVVNFMMGVGNDTLEVEGTLNPAPFVQAENDFSAVENWQAATVDNVDGTDYVFLTNQQPELIGATLITREGFDWKSQGFLAGQSLFVMDGDTPILLGEIIAIEDRIEYFDGSGMPLIDPDTGEPYRDPNDNSLLFIDPVSGVDLSAFMLAGDQLLIAEDKDVFQILDATVAINAGAVTLKRNDGASWANDAFLEGHLLQIGIGENTKQYRIVEFQDSVEGSGVGDVLLIEGVGETLLQENAGLTDGQTFTQEAFWVQSDHGGLTVLHGGGNLYVNSDTNFDFDATENELTRLDGRSFEEVGFEIGQIIQVGDETHTREILDIIDADQADYFDDSNPAPFETWGTNSILVLSDPLASSAGATVLANVENTPLLVSVAEALETSLELDVRVEVIERGTTIETYVTLIGDDAGSTWEGLGYLEGGVLFIEGYAGGFQIAEINGNELQLLNAALEDCGNENGEATLRITTYDETRSGGQRVGGDHFIVTGGAGPESPLVIYGDTSQDGMWYAGESNSNYGLEFGDKPFDPFPDLPNDENEDDTWVMALATPFDLHGNDIIDASALFDDMDGDGQSDNIAAQTISVGITAYGGMGNDKIYGSQAGDHLAGGSGDDTIIGGRGTDHIYGDSGFNVDVLTRALTVATTNLSPEPTARDGAPGGDTWLSPTASTVADLMGVRPDDPLLQAEAFEDYGAAPGAGSDLIEGNGTGISDETPDIIFGDHGEVVQFVIDPNLPDPVGLTYLGEPVFAGIPQKIQTTVLGSILEINSVEPQTGGDDIIFGSEIDDLLIGGAGNDLIDGGTGDDLIFGDNVNLERRGGVQGGDISSLRFQTLAGTQLYSRSDRDLSDGYSESEAQGPNSGVLMVTLEDDGSGNLVPVARDFRDPNGPGWWTEYDIDYSEYHTFDVEAGITGGGSFGNDYIAGGAGNDQIFGQLGNDIIQGDGTIDGAVATKGDGTAIGDDPDNPLFGGLIVPDYYVSAARELPSIEGDGVRDPIGALKVVAATQSGHADDGNDYIEGGGGCDVVFGGLGQDDIVGGSSSFFNLTDADQRPDGEDKIFGGTGALVTRNNELAADDGTEGYEVGITLEGDEVIGAGRNARDADVILGDNGDIIRIVGINNIDVLDTNADGVNDIESGAFDGEGIVWIAPDASEYADRYTTRSTLAVAGDGTAYMTGGLYLAFNYDVNLDQFEASTGTAVNEFVRDTGYNDEGGERIVVRGVTTLDYLAGGPDYAPNAGAFDLDLPITLDKNATVPEGGDLWRSTFGFWSLTDIGGNDEVHGGSGDDAIYLGGGDDIAFGDSDHDDIIGGWGNDWISGGPGNDGIIGDDGRIFTSRNTGVTDDGSVSLKGNTRSFGNYGTEFAEELFGVWALLNNDPDTRTSQGVILNEEIYTPGNVQRALINKGGDLVKSVDLSPFDVIDGTINPVSSADPSSHDPQFADDVIFGGLGDDSVHGGSGDDAIGGQEALRDSYMVWFEGDLPTSSVDNPNNGGTGMVLVRTDFTRPWNPGNILLFGDGDDHWNEPNPIQQRTGEFYLYDEYDPRRVILFNDDGTLWKDGDADNPIAPPDGIRQYFLNAYDNEGIDVIGVTDFEPNGTPIAGSERIVQSDGNDAIFGDMGNDWIVGGTGRDHIYGGFGNDLMNADDVQGGPGTSYDNGLFGSADNPGGDRGLNFTPETHFSWEDRVFGGAGLDILIGNTGGDRLIDHLGEFNSYIVPFAPFGIATVSRQVPPQLWDFLTAQAASDGVDMTRTADVGGLTATQDSRYSAVIQQQGNPHGELGLVTQRDRGFWQDQSGPPSDPQAGNIPGGRRDILRTADFNDRSGDGFGVDRGKFEATGGAMEIASDTSNDTASAVFLLDDFKPSYFEVEAVFNLDKPTGGWKSNGYIIFDYYSDTDFKFAGINVSTNKIEMGYVDETGWNYVEQSNKPVRIKPGQNYNVLVAINGNNVTVSVAGVNWFSYDYTPRIDVYGEEIPLARGLVGVGMDGSRGKVDNFKVQILPPDWTLEEVDDFKPPVAELPRSVISSEWIESSGTLTGIANGTAPAVQVVELGVGLLANSILEMNADIKTDGVSGFIFDRYDAFDYKFIALDVPNDRIIVGHATAEDGQVIDASYSVNLSSNKAARLQITMQGAGVDIKLNGSEVATYGFNSALVDGQFGLTVLSGEGEFENFRLATNDSQFEEALTLAAQSAQSVSGDSYITGTEPSLEDLQRIYDAALTDWIEAGYVTDDEAVALASVTLELRDLEGDTLARAIEPDTIQIDATAAGAGWYIAPEGEEDSTGLISAGVDLLTVMRHEIGHLLGLEHDDLQVMSAELDAATRVSVTEEADATSGTASGTGDTTGGDTGSTDSGSGDTGTGDTDGSTNTGKGKKSAALVFDPATGDLVDSTEADHLFASRKSSTTDVALASGATALAAQRLAKTSRIEGKPGSTKAKRLTRWFKRSA